MAQGTGDQIESKARNPRFPGRAHFRHVVSSAWSTSFRPGLFLLPRLALRTLTFFLPALLFHILPSSLLAKSLFYPPLPPVYTSLPLCFLLRPAFVSLLSYSSQSLLLPPSACPSRRTLAGQPQSSTARLPSSRGPATPTATRSSCTRARGAQRLEEVQEDTGEAVPLERRRLATCELSFHSSNFDRSKGNFFIDI